MKSYTKRELLAMTAEQLSQLYTQLTTPGVRLRTENGKKYLAANALGQLVT